MIVLLSAVWAVSARTAGDLQSSDTASVVSPAAYVQRSGTLDVFMGVDFNYRDKWLNNNRVFDLLINLTPSLKWRLPYRIDIAAEVVVPVVNQYGPYYKYVRLNMASVAKQFAVGDHWKSKVSAGLFGLERYGLDWKNMYIFNSWLAATAEFGLTGHCFMGHTWTMSTMKKFTVQVGPEVYLRKWNTQLALKGGRYVYDDWGLELEAMRHFRHVTFSVYGYYSSDFGTNGGFKVVVALPPYKRHQRRVNFRPASSFRVTYSAKAEAYGNLNYRTDPEQNERVGWFDRDLLPWGIDLMKPDFTVARPKTRDTDNDRKEEAAR